MNQTWALPGDSEEPRAIVLSTPPRAWESISHTVEVVAGQRSRAPHVPLLWLSDPGEDEWLARHDLHHLGIQGDPAARVLPRTRLLPGRPLLIVRTGYTATDPRLALAAAREGIPTVGFDLGDLPVDAAQAVAPFAVETLLDQVLSLLDDDRRQALGTAMCESLRREHEPDHRLDPLHELLGGRRHTSCLSGPET